MQILGRWRIDEMEVWEQESIEPTSSIRRVDAAGQLTLDGSLEGRIYFHMGDGSSFRAEPDAAAPTS